jgi:hypothetical protein
VKADFMSKLLRRDKEGHHILIKVTISHEDTTIINMHAQNIGSSNFLNKH